MFFAHSPRLEDYLLDYRKTIFFLCSLFCFVLLGMSRAVSAFSTLFLLSLLKIEKLTFPFSDSEKRFLYCKHDIELTVNAKFGLLIDNSRVLSH